MFPVTWLLEHVLMTELGLSSQSVMHEPGNGVAMFLVPEDRTEHTVEDKREAFACCTCVDRTGWREHVNSRTGFRGRGRF